MTQRNKNILLIIGFLLLLLVAYQFAFSKTFHLKSEIASLKQQNVNIENLARLSTNLSQRNKFADSILAENNIKNIYVQNSLLEFLNNESSKKGFSIEEFFEPHISNKNEVKVTSYRFTLKGSFDDLQQILYQVEQEYSFGEVKNVNLERKRDFRQGKDYLVCSVIIESYLSE